MGKWMIRWLFFLCFFFCSGPQYIGWHGNASNTRLSNALASKIVTLKKGENVLTRKNVKSMGFTGSQICIYRYIELCHACFSFHGRGWVGEVGGGSRWALKAKREGWGRVCDEPIAGGRRGGMASGARCDESEFQYWCNFHEKLRGFQSMKGSSGIFSPPRSSYFSSFVGGFGGGCWGDLRIM